MSSQNTPTLLLLLLLLLLLTVVNTSADPLSDLAKALSNRPPDWRPGSDPCKWTGITCTSGQVTSIDLRSKSLSGSIPADFFSGLPSLQDFSIDNNPLSPWTLPDSIAQCTSLHSFSAANSSVTGSIPQALGQLPGLQDLKLSYNNLTGTLPASFAGSSIRSLYVNNQKSTEKLSGTIDVVGKMDQLSLVWLQSNSLVGPVPDVSNLTMLVSFNARDNLLTGPVPASLVQSKTLTNASLANNLLQGQMPVFANGINADVDKGNAFCGLRGEKCDPRVDVLLAVAGGFGYPVSLAQSWTRNDPCRGNWPGVTCDPQGKDVIVLNLANQKLVGTISPDVANLTSLSKLILSNNNLTGKIPDTLTGLKSLQLLDASNNNLWGKVPEFDQSVSVKLSGNPLIGKEVGPEGGDPSGSSDGKSKSTVGVIVGIVVAVIVLVGCFAGLKYHLKGKKGAMLFRPVHARTPSNEPELIKVGVMNIDSGDRKGSSDDVNTIPIKELEIATNYFSDAYVIGRGGFGVVYKGELNGTPIAVKRSESQGMGKAGMEEFEAEVHVLQKTRHRHLVSFLGYCQENNEKLLVYEYMPEGTLGQHLFDRDEGKYVALNWKQRLVIALDVARGIEYLHSLAQESFIHRDLKPSNILLDKDLRAKVSDFGLVKLADKEKSVMTRLAGTFGYLAPEYALTGKVSTKVDVYAYGVILMELITGRKALDETVPDEDSHLVMAFRRYFVNKDKFLSYVDPSLDLDASAQESIFQVAELARHCTAREPNQRPSMGHPVQVLSPLVDHWVPSKYTVDEDDSSMNLSRTLAKWKAGDDTFSATLTS